MKKLLVLSAATFVLASAIIAHPSDEFVKSNMATQNSHESAIKKEKKEGKKESRRLRNNDVSVLSQDQFYSDFGNIPETEWKRAGIYDEASFIRGGLVVHAYYDTDSKLVGTTIDITFADLPSNAQKIINEKYKDFTVGDVLLYRDSDNGLNDGSVLNNRRLDDGDSYFVELKKMDKETLFQLKADGVYSFYPLPKENNNGYARK